jgi:hypothetical protein
MQALAGGKDIDQLPEFYVPYAQVADALLKHALPLSRLKPGDADQRGQLARLEAGANGQQLKYLPLVRNGASYAAIIATASKRPIAVLPIDPW